VQRNAPNNGKTFKPEKRRRFITGYLTSIAESMSLSADAQARVEEIRTGETSGRCDKCCHRDYKQPAWNIGVLECWSATPLKNRSLTVIASVIMSYDSIKMVLQINFKSGNPVYLQIVDQIKAAAASGAVQAGESLPSIRPLAEELRVNRNTIAKAYNELENQGVIETIPGKGSFVKPNNSPLKKEVRRKLLIEEIDHLIVKAHHLQVTPSEVVEIVRERLEVLEQKQQASGRALMETK